VFDSIAIRHLNNHFSPILKVIDKLLIYLNKISLEAFEKVDSTDNINIIRMNILFPNLNMKYYICVCFMCYLTLRLGEKKDSFETIYYVFIVSGLNKRESCSLHPKFNYSMFAFTMVTSPNVCLPQSSNLELVFFTSNFALKREKA